MINLNNIVTDKVRRKELIEDCVQLINNEVESKSGLSGLAVKGAFAVVKAIKPGMVPHVVDHMLNDFATQLDPLIKQTVARSADELERSMIEQAHSIANALLRVSDERAQNANNRTLQKAYEKLRPAAVKYVEAAVPNMAKMLRKYVA